MAEKVEFRNYNPNEDYPRVREILEEGGLFDDVWDSEERYRQRILNAPDSMILATIEGQIIGTQFLVDDLYPYMFRLCVKSEFRGQGIGTSLMEEGIRRLKEHGHKEVGIFVDDQDEELKGWYQRMGFNLSGTYRSMWREI